MTTNVSNSNKTLFRVLLAGAAVLILCGAAVGAAAGATDHPHASLTEEESTMAHPDFTGTWTNWGDEEAEWTSLPNTVGNYYLTHDVTLSSTWNVPGTTNLCLNGYVIKRDSTVDSSTKFSLITIPADTTLNLYDCDTTTTHAFKVNGDGLWVLNGESGDEKTVTGGCITGGSATSAGGVYVYNGEFTMNGGNIVGNSASGSGSNGGGGVCVRNSGTFHMFGGQITGNTANNGNGGGGVLNWGTFNMSGGSITNNTANNGNAGGVYVIGTFHMTNGSITNNTATGAGDGGGVYVGGPNPSFTMSGGEITYNTANNPDGGGGGVYVANGTFEMKNSNTTPATYGTITSNTAAHSGGGAYVCDDSKFTVSGSAVIKANTLTTTGSINNVELEEVEEEAGHGFYLSGDFTGDIGITLIDNEPPKRGDQFGFAVSGVSGADKIIADGISNLHGCISDGKLYWGPVERKSSSSSQSQGSSIWLTEQQYTVTFYLDGYYEEVYQKQLVSAGQTAAVPTPAPTAEGYRFDGWYTDPYCTVLYDFTSKVYSNLNLFAGWSEMPVVKPIVEQPTAKSPAPFAGVLAGLGAAAVVFWLRRR